MEEEIGDINVDDKNIHEENGDSRDYCIGHDDVYMCSFLCI